MRALFSIRSPAITPAAAYISNLGVFIVIFYKMLIIQSCQYGWHDFYVFIDNQIRRYNVIKSVRVGDLPSLQGHYLVFIGYFY